MKLVGNNNRMAIIKTINTLLNMNGVDVEIVLKPLKFNDFSDGGNVTTNTNTTDKNQDTDENNIIERADKSEEEEQ